MSDESEQVGASEAADAVRPPKGITWPQVIAVVTLVVGGSGGSTVAANFLSPPADEQRLRADERKIEEQAAAIAALQEAQKRNAEQIKQVIQTVSFHQSAMQHPGADQRLGQLEKRAESFELKFDEILKTLGRIEGSLSR